MTDTLVQSLYTLGRPKTLAPKDWGNYREQGFDESTVPALIDIIRNGKSVVASIDTPAIWATVYAWRILGQLGSTEAIVPLIGLFEEFSDDDWGLDELPLVLGMIGPAAIEPLAKKLNEQQCDQFSRATAAESLEKIVKYHPEARSAVLEKYREYLQQPALDSATLNGLILSSILNVGGVELLEEIRQLFALDCVDYSIVGDLEEVEIILGVQRTRSTPKPNFSPFADKFNALIDAYGNNAADDWDATSSPYSRMDDVDYAPTLPYERTEPKVGRNDPCICGSGKKYKKCCLNN